MEIRAIEENETWELTTLLEGAKKIGVKWVFKTKFNEKGEVDKFKVRLVSKVIHNSMESITMRWLLQCPDGIQSG